MSNYPAQIDTSQSLPTVVDGQTPVRGAIFNKLRDAVIAIESELGTKPSSIYSTVKNRLDTIENNVNIVSAINLNGDVIGPFNSTQIVALRGKPLSSVAPALNQVLGWDGISWGPLTPVYSNAVGGDLTGFLPNPLVTGLFGNPIANTAPSVQDVLTWDGSSWTPSPGFTAGNGLFISGNTINVGANADQTIVVNATDIQVNPNFYSSNSINGTLVQRDTNFGFINVSDSFGSARYGSGIVVSEAGKFNVQQTQKSSNIAALSMKFSPQAPYSLATGSNRLPGNLIFDIAPAAGALASTTSGNVSFVYGGVERVRIESNPTVPAGVITFPSHGQINTTGNLQTVSTGLTEIDSGGDLILSGGNDTSITGGDSINIGAPDISLTSNDILLDTGAFIINQNRNLLFTQDPQTTNTVCNDITFNTQAPYASAIGANQLPGNFVFDIPSPSGASAAVDSGRIKMKFGGTEYIRFSATPSGPVGYIDFFQEGQINATTSFVLQTAGPMLLSQTQQSSNIDCNDITILSQAPYPSATGTNQLPGNIILNTPAAVGGSATTDSGFIMLKSGSTEYVKFGFTPSNQIGNMIFDGYGFISAVDGLSISGTTIGIASAGFMNLDSPDFSITSAGNVSVSCDNLMTFTSGGDFTLNNNGGLFSIVNQASGISLTDPAGGGITIDANGGASLALNCASGIELTTSNVTVDSSGADFNFIIDSNPTSSGTGYLFNLSGSGAPTGSGTGGNIQLTPGIGNNFNGNIAFHTAPSSAAGAAGGANVIWIGNRTGAPGTNPSGGFIFYSESGNAKIRAGANTVTLGNKPSVTGSKAAGAALVSLLTVLAAAGLITDNTTA